MLSVHDRVKVPAGHWSCGGRFAQTLTWYIIVVQPLASYPASVGASLEELASLGVPASMVVLESIDVVASSAEPLSLPWRTCSP